MKEAAFLDTVYVLALLNPRDGWHAKAVELSGHTPARLVTTEAVLAEVANGLSRSAWRTAAVQAIDDLRSDPDVTCVTTDGALFERALDLYRQRHDKDWSLTDCISFLVMQDHGLDQALSLTADRNFEQAGFRALLRA